MKFHEDDECLLHNHVYLSISFSVTQSYCLGSLLKVKTYFSWIIKTLESLRGWFIEQAPMIIGQSISLSEGSVSYIYDIADAAQDHIHSLIDTLFVQ